MAQGPKFGSAGRSTRYSVNQSAEKLELQDGFETDQFFRRKTDVREETVEKLLSYGIANSTQNPFGTPLTSVTYTETEESVQHESWTEREANTVDEDQGGALVAIDAMLYTRKHETWSVSGYGAVPEVAADTPWKVGDYVETTPLEIEAASTGPDDNEVVSIIIPVGAFLESLSIEGENTNWSTFTLTFSSYTPQTNTNPLIPFIPVYSPLNEDVQWADETTPGYWTKTTRTTTLTAEGFASVTTSTELFEKHPIPTNNVTGVEVLP